MAQAPNTLGPTFPITQLNHIFHQIHSKFVTPGSLLQICSRRAQTNLHSQEDFIYYTRCFHQLLSGLYLSIYQRTSESRRPFSLFVPLWLCYQPADPCCWWSGGVMKREEGERLWCTTWGLLTETFKQLSPTAASRHLHSVFIWRCFKYTYSAYHKVSQQS